MSSVSVQTTALGLDVAWLHSWDHWVWIGVGRDVSSSPGDTFSELVRVSLLTRSVELTIDVEDDSPFDAGTCEIVDFCVDFYGYLYILVSGDDTGVPKMDVMKYQPTGLLIYSCYDEGITNLDVLAHRLEVDPSGNIGVMTSADESDIPGGRPIALQVISQA